MSEMKYELYLEDILENIRRQGILIVVTTKILVIHGEIPSQLINNLANSS